MVECIDIDCLTEVETEGERCFSCLAVELTLVSFDIMSGEE